MDLPDLVWLVEAENVGDLVLLLSVGYVVEPALGAPLLVRVKQRHIFEVDWLSINDGLPVVHPGDLGRSGEVVCVL